MLTGTGNKLALKPETKVLNWDVHLLYLRTPFFISFGEEESVDTVREGWAPLLPEILVGLWWQGRAVPCFIPPVLLSHILSPGLTVPCFIVSSLHLPIHYLSIVLLITMGICFNKLPLKVNNEQSNMWCICASTPHSCVHCEVHFERLLEYLPPHNTRLWAVLGLMQEAVGGGKGQLSYYFGPSCRNDPEKTDWRWDS